MASTTIDLDTELSAVNSILGAIGQSPLTALNLNANGVFDNPEVAIIYNLLRDANVDTQAEGWHFNTEKHVKFSINTDGKIAIGGDVLRMDTTDGWVDRTHDVVKRSGYLYDKYNHTDDFSDHTTIKLDIVKLIAFEDIPSVFQRYIIYKASRMAATQLVANAQLVQLLQLQEQQARATCQEYECNQGNHNMFGLPEDSVYTAYEPWKNLRR